MGDWDGMTVERVGERMILSCLEATHPVMELWPPNTAQRCIIQVAGSRLISF